ncbi:hypothetical protein FACS1894188_01180 [Clostridia bacterium]|nr:hypothetical protein FACS1894188_01180 [Clostridia bacterium]
MIVKKSDLQLTVVITVMAVYALYKIQPEIVNNIISSVWKIYLTLVDKVANEMINAITIP